MFTLVTGRHVGGLKEVLQHGGSILGSVILCGTFRRISQLWDNAHTLNLENCLLYLLSTISQFFDFVRCIVFDFIFYCVTAHTLYTAFGYVFNYSKDGNCSSQWMIVNLLFAVEQFCYIFSVQDYLSRREVFVGKVHLRSSTLFWASARF